MTHHDEHDDGRTPAVIEREIEQTRERMTHEIDAIGEKFTPAHIKQEAREAIQSAGEAAMEKAKQAGNGLLELARANPLPSALIGAGIFWLAMEARKGNRGQSQQQFASTNGHGVEHTGTMTHLKEGAVGAIESVKDATSTAVDTVKEKTGDLASQAGKKLDQWKDSATGVAEQASTKARTFYESNPLIAAAAVAVLGAAIGALIPPSTPERKLMGNMRDKVVEKAKEKTGEVTEQAKGVAQQAVQNFTDAFARKPEPGNGQGREFNQYAQPASIAGR